MYGVQYCSIGTRCALAGSACAFVGSIRLPAEFVMNPINTCLAALGPLGVQNPTPTPCASVEKNTGGIRDQSHHPPRPTEISKIIFADQAATSTTQICCLIRCTVAVPAPVLRAVSRTPRPAISIALICSIRSVAIGGRPSRFFPRTRSRPATTLERIMALSNSEKTPSSWNSMRPDGVDVSMAC